MWKQRSIAACLLVVAVLLLLNLAVVFKAPESQAQSSVYTYKVLHLPVMTPAWVEEAVNEQARLGWRLHSINTGLLVFVAP